MTENEKSSAPALEVDLPNDPEVLVSMPEPVVLDGVDVDAFENGLRREVLESRPKVETAPTISGGGGWSFGGGCDCNEDDGLVARVTAVIQVLDIAAKSDHVGLTARDRAKAAAGALRWVLDDDEPSPAETVF